MFTVFQLLAAADLWPKAAARRASVCSALSEGSPRHYRARPSPRQRSQRAPRSASPGGRRRRREVRGAIFKSLGPAAVTPGRVVGGVSLCEGEPGCEEDRAVRESRAVSGAGLAAALLRAWGCTSWRTGGDPPRPLLGPLARWPGPLSPRRRDGRSQRSSVPAVPPPGTACCGLCGLLRPVWPAAFGIAWHSSGAGGARSLQAFKCLRLSALLFTSGPQPRAL